MLGPSLESVCKRIESLRKRGLEIRDSMSERQKPKSRMVCEDCGCVSEGYMLEDSVWLEAHPSGLKGIVCIHCVTASLGRPLGINDFTKSLVNLPVFAGMAAVLGAIGQEPR